MGKRTSYEPGTFSWVELSTTDVDGAKQFYGGLFGWEFEDMPVPDAPPYSMARIGGDAVAAAYPQQAEQRDAGVPPNWFSYVTVESADATAERTKELGGAVHAGPFDVMEAGRMAVLADPTGAMLGAWQAGESIGAERVNDPSSLTWNELATNDAEAASRFYGDLFGWRIEEMETGGGPRYWMIGHDGAASGRNGGMRELGAAEEGVPPNWVPYFATGSVDETVGRAEELGGSTLVPTMEIPAGKLAGLRDPQGAAFSVFEGDFDD